MKDAIGYVRVSSEEQADRGLVLDAQRQRIAAYFTMKGLHLAEVFEDPDVSAGNPPRWQQVAELERAMIRERTRSATSVKRARGEPIAAWR